MLVIDTSKIILAGERRESIEIVDLVGISLAAGSTKPLSVNGKIVGDSSIWLNFFFFLLYFKKQTSLNRIITISLDSDRIYGVRHVIKVATQRPHLRDNAEFAKPASGTWIFQYVGG